MLVGELLRECRPLPEGLSFKKVVDVTDNSRDVKRGSLFFAIKGYKSDGNSYIEEAFKRGALAVITDSKEAFSRFKDRHPIILVDNVRKYLSLSVSRFYGNPQESVELVGITGTNGKTTTSFILYQVLNRLDVLTGIVGTVKVGIPNEEFPSERTTPSPVKFFKILKEMVKRGVKRVVLEVSSHGLELYRIYPARFKYSCFTNLSIDHLDFHGTMESYFTSKERLFFYTDGFGFINLDDSYGKLLYSLRNIFSCKVITYGKRGDFSFKFRPLRDGTLVFVNGSEFKTNLKGEFNVYNLVAAYAVLSSMGFTDKDLKDAFTSLYIPGRLQEVREGIFVDYAHTPDALENVLRTLRLLSPNRLISVFGCGGDRDKVKRPLMGKIAERYSDLVILTSDNPRSERPEEIVSDILSGVSDKSKFKVILDRKEAILEALKEKKVGDFLLIAGKGHEDYQEINGRRIPFSDVRVVEEFYEGV